VNTPANEPSLWRTADGNVRAPWQITIFGLAVLGASVIVGTIGYELVALTPVRSWARAVRLSLSPLATMGAIILATWAMPRVIRNPAITWGDIGLGRSAWRPALVLPGFLLGAAVIAIPTLALIVTGEAELQSAEASDSWMLAAWTATAVLVPSALSEELLFRGVVFTVGARALGTTMSVALTSVIFALAHLSNPDPTALAMIGVTLAGIFLATVRVATGSLAAAFAAHLGVNFAQAVFFHSPVSGLAMQTPGYRLVETGPDWLTGGAWGPEAGIAVIAAMLGAILMLRRKPDDGRPTTDDGQHDIKT
jgi:membrane protease YdiL (CAAX protease family)